MGVSRSARVTAATIVALLPAAGVPSSLAGQTGCITPYSLRGDATSLDTVPPPCPMPSRWVLTHRVDFVVNVGLGMVTAGLRAGLAHRPLWPALRRGAVGGAFAYAGKRVIGTGKPGLRLAGRQISAVGASVVRNAGDGRGVFDGAVLPLGPIRFYVHAPTGDRPSSKVRIKLDLAGMASLGYIATRPGARLNVGTSLTTGTPVFNDVQSGGPLHMAQHNAGVIGLGGHSVDPVSLSHELVHVAQYDFTFIAWGQPVERALVPLLPGGTFAHRYVDLGANMGVWGLGRVLWSHADRPWEREASLMTERGP